MPDNHSIHQHLLDLTNKVEKVEDKIDTLLHRLSSVSRTVGKIARHLASDHADAEKAKALTAELATAADELEAAVDASTPKPN